MNLKDNKKKPQGVIRHHSPPNPKQNELHFVFTLVSNPKNKNKKTENYGHQIRDNQPFGYSVPFHTFKQLSRFSNSIQEMSSQLSKVIPSSIINSKKQSLESLRVHELKDMASEMNIKGRSVMRKQQLVDAIMSQWVKEQEKLNEKNSQSLPVPILRREKTLHNCHGLTIEGDNLVNCQNKSDKKFCPDHQHRYRLEKPDDCPICMDTISITTETPLECGHWIHKECLVPTNLHICPVCRQSMKPHEIAFIFGDNHQQYNQYSHNYYQPFVSESLFSQQIIIQGANDVNMIDIGDFNNQEHFFQDQSEYLFEDENHNGLEFHNDFDEQPGAEQFNEHQDNLFDEEQQINQHVNEVENQISENAFSNMTNEILELIIQEIETRPRFNPYVTLANNMTEIPNYLRNSFIQFVNRVIDSFALFNNFIIDDLMNEEITSQLFAIDNNHNLLRIYFNMTFSPYMEVDFLIRIETLVNDRIREIHDQLTFNF